MNRPPEVPEMSDAPDAPDAPGAPEVPEWFTRLSGAIDRLRFPERPVAGSITPPLIPPVFAAPPRHSAVLMLFGTSEQGDDVLLTRRASTLRAHAGQVAFPGGRLDDGDASPAAAALREAQEETGLDPAGVEVHALGADLLVSVSNFVVTPVLGWWRRPSPVAPVDPAEVDAVVRVPLAALTDPANRFTAVHSSGFTGPAFEVDDLFVWGFTAGVLAALLRLAELEQPWDVERRVPLDARAGSLRPPAPEELR